MLTPDAKKLLAETIRGTAQDPDKGIRARLLRAIHDEADRRYRLSVPLQKAGLDEASGQRRKQLEEWIAEQGRAAKPKNKVEQKATADRLLAQAEKEAAATLVNRLVLLRHLEALGLSKPPVLTGGWNSKGYREYREFAPALCADVASDSTEGYAGLLQLVFDERAVDLPGLFGDVGLTRLFPIPAAALREVVERLDAPDLVSAWTDDTTLGWVYQYWNDPDREVLDAKINGGGKIEPHEIASKTQMFTERYMVEWLLQNSLGLTWLAMCKRHGWTADAERVLPELDARRAAWRTRRESGEVALDALMPIEGELEEHWKYFVPQPIPDDAVAKAPDSVRAIKLLDPACGSGHFLVIAFDLLAAMYREEARHRGVIVSDAEIAESILENNLHGIDIDPRAVQLAAAGLYLKAKAFAKAAHPRSVNLVAPVLQLGKLPADDGAVVALVSELEREVGVPEALTRRLLAALSGVDYLGSLLRVDVAIEEAIGTAELQIARTHGQGDLFGGFPVRHVTQTAAQAKASVIGALERFLARRSRAQDLGLRLDGEQLAAGVRFVRLAKEGAYDVVVGNPPYQGLSKTAQFEYVAKTYPKGRADLYAAFLERGLQLVREGGVSGLLTMRGWMFLGQFAELRKELLRTFDLRLLGDVDRGAFEDVPDEVLSTVMSVFTRAAPGTLAVGMQPTPPEDRARDGGRTARKRAAVLAQVGRHEFDPRGFDVIEGEPIVYWWTKDFLAKYAAAPKLGEIAPVRQGLITADNTRFVRRWWEARPSRIKASQGTIALSEIDAWVPYIKGAVGRAWFEPLTDIVLWRDNGLQIKTFERDGKISSRPQNEHSYFRRGVAFSPIGAVFSARLHRFTSIFDSMGSSVFPDDLNAVCALMNSTVGRRTLQSINPTIHFQVGDVNRLADFRIDGVDSIFAILEQSFTLTELGREGSFEFQRAGGSDWDSAQQWAQTVTDRPEGSPLPPYGPTYHEPLPEAHVSFAIGVALGRFGAQGEGILDAAPATALPAGTLFVSAVSADSADGADGQDSLAHPACAPLAEAWKPHGPTIATGTDLSTWLRKSFFDFHKKLYENRPIYFPLSSAKKSFVAYVSIHRWQDDTLTLLLADHLVPTRRRLEGELDDLRTARASASGPARTRAERRFTDVQRLLEELVDFITKVTDLAERGAPPPDDKTTARETDARFVMDLDDGVMINSAALWPLLEPQWKDPKKWWKELANAQGKKDYDWSHLAARYFPTRVRAKCHEDPSLAVAHHCFWELHPAKAYAWELRLQDEIRPDFTIDEPSSDAHRAAFLKDHAGLAAELVAKEQKRREKKAAKGEATEDAEAPLFDAGRDEDGDRDSTS